MNKNEINKLDIPEVSDSFFDIDVRHGIHQSSHMNDRRGRILSIFIKIFRLTRQKSYEI